MCHKLQLIKQSPVDKKLNNSLTIFNKALKTRGEKNKSKEI